MKYCITLPWSWLPYKTHCVAMYLTWYAKHLRVACLNIVLKEMWTGKTS